MKPAVIYAKYARIHVSTRAIAQGPVQDARTHAGWTGKHIKSNGNSVNNSIFTVSVRLYSGSYIRQNQKGRE